jgi:MFS family permease
MSVTTPEVLAADAKVSRWVTRDVIFILAAQVVFGFGWSLYLLTPKFLTTELHAGPDVIGWTSAAGGLAALLTVPFAAVGLDRVGRKPFFQLGAALIVLLSFGFLHVREVSWLVFVLQGCVAAAFVLAFNANATLIADFTPPEKLGQAIGWLGGANVLMNAVATVIAEPLAMRYGWHVVFEMGLVAGCAALVLSLLLREAPSRLPARAGATAGPPPQSAGHSALPAILVSTVLIGCVFSAMFSFVQPYALNAGAREVRGFFLGFTASAVAARLLLGSLGDRLGRRAVSVAMMLGYALCALLTMHLRADWLALYGLMFGAAHGVLYPTLSALVLETSSLARRGLGMVLFNGAFNVGTMLSSLLWGLLAERHGYPVIYATAAVFGLLAAGVLARSRPRFR